MSLDQAPGHTLLPSPTQIAPPPAQSALLPYSSAASTTLRSQSSSFQRTKAEAGGGGLAHLPHSMVLCQVAVSIPGPAFLRLQSASSLIHIYPERRDNQLGPPRSSLKSDPWGCPSFALPKLHHQASSLGRRGGEAWGEGRARRERGRLGGGLGAAGLVGNACHSSSVPTQPGSSTHQEREIESIPVRHVNGPGTGD